VFESIINSFFTIHFAFYIAIFAILSQLLLLSFFILNWARSKVSRVIITLFSVVIACSIFTDTYWAIRYAEKLSFIATNYSFLAGMAWALTVLQFLVIFYFVNRILPKKFKLNYYSIWLITLIAAILMGNFIFYIFSNVMLLGNYSYTLVDLYVMLVAVLITYKIIKIILNKTIPKLLQQQLMVYAFIFPIPYFLVDFVPSLFSIFSYPYQSGPLLESLGRIIFVAALFFSMRKLLKIRFLNVAEEVTAQHRAGFFEDYEPVFEEVSNASTIGEVRHIVKQFFSDVFGQDAHKIHLF